jgi:hypothetical protein
MTAITQETLQQLWARYAPRLNKDGDPDVIRGDFNEEVSRLGGIVISGRGGLDQPQADAVVHDLRRRGCTVLRDPAREGEETALVLFHPDQDDEGKQLSAEPCVAESGQRTKRRGLSPAEELIRDLSTNTVSANKRSKTMEIRARPRRSRKVWTKPTILPPIDPALYQDLSIALRSQPVFLNKPPEEQKADEAGDSQAAEPGPESLS